MLTVQTGHESGWRRNAEREPRVPDRPGARIGIAERTGVPVSPPELYDEPTVVGVPYVYWLAGENSGHRFAYCRLEGLPEGTLTVATHYHPSFSGVPSGYDFNTIPAAALAGGGYEGNIWTEDMIKPWYGVGEVAPIGIDIIVNGATVYTYDQPLTISTTGHPPTSYQG